ncbi:cupredoxin domain-containing protein [Aquihabitans sp. G128]|uniref:cupredoxin domain-containing protein n=1 Tax=Aquihabitans sp. G128 TaxID=2849779 RepID=UPI001C23087D|nr:cupredoxin domain-containing protein [Aquihabitans sp. G128]QXC61602.1 cupredoxin domain-containing protein [Aquihabitans sp. G128]
MPHRTAALVGAAIVLCLASGCTDNPSGSADGTGAKVKVSSTDDACTLSATTAASGSLVFSVTNDGAKPTEFYLLGSDGADVVGEVENIGPGVTRSLTVQAEKGTYTTMCKPGMVGKGIRAPFKVTDT